MTGSGVVYIPARAHQSTWPSTCFLERAQESAATEFVGARYLTGEDGRNADGKWTSYHRDSTHHNDSVISERSGDPRRSRIDIWKDCQDALLQCCRE